MSIFTGITKLFSGSKTVAVITIIITLIVGVPSTAFITSKIDKKKYEMTITTLTSQIKEWKDVVIEAIKLPKYQIANTYTIEKNKKGQMVFTPTNNMEVNDVLKSINKKMEGLTAPIDTLVIDTTSVEVKKNLWQWIKDIFK
jgi:hypothetical protein